MGLVTSAFLAFCILSHLSRTLVSHIRAPKHRGPERVGLGSWRMRLRPQGVTDPRSWLPCACLVSGVHLFRVCTAMCGVRIHGQRPAFSNHSYYVSYNVSCNVSMHSY